MAKYNRFHDVPAWQEATRLYNRTLELLETRDFTLTPTLRGHLERSALAVSNSIAVGFEQPNVEDLLPCLAAARTATIEVRSIIAGLKARPKLSPFLGRMDELSNLAESCNRQVYAWSSAVERSSRGGKTVSEQRAARAE